jgi:hypothetical protein
VHPADGETPRGAAAQRRHRDVPGEGSRPQPLRVLRGAHERRRQWRACRSERATAPRARRGEFRLVYQAQFDLATGQVAAAEALLRWRRDDGTLLLPGSFIAQPRRPASSSGSALWVLEEACRQQSEWLREGVAPRASRSTCRRSSSARGVSRRGRARARTDRRSADRARARDHREPADGPGRATSSARSSACSASACASRSTTSAPAIRRWRT